eukprot:CAMPEP_0113632700 /NCGR_PEP_ID=MMETSP0017_2-20120614/17002_1 /TAXON_ID=2856 /ORGANISM="Cylindrotheca closterium" /LENGTH=331 /DNA_ID=CAMNT_0000543277 /DNA_START=248 /DNA_END=1243 /DNA_ORIENTATION=- /assembly_acc=CAM_ASM_000147
MPDNSSNAIILTSLRDIEKALRNPSPRTPIAPRSDSLTEALRKIVELLQNVVLEREPPAPPLRVPKAKEAPHMIQTPATIPTTASNDSTSPDTAPNNEPPANIIPENTPHLIPLDNDSAPTAPAPTPTTAKQVRWTDVVNTPTVATPAAPLPTVTYDALTGPKVRARQRRERHRKKQTTKQTKKPTKKPPQERPSSQSQTPKPILKASSKPAVATPSTEPPPLVHRRSQRQPKPSYKKKAQANLSTASAPPTVTFDDLHYLCLHGTDINPDTGKIAEYQELLQSSAGDLWSAANDEEVGRMCDGLDFASFATNLAKASISVNASMQLQTAK